MPGAVGADRGQDPERRCIVTRRSGPRSGLVRFVVSPSGDVVPDVAERLPGRGLWITACSDIVARACAENSFAKALRRSVRVPADMPARLSGLMDRHCMALISLARRSGVAVSGFERVMAMVRSGEAGMLLEASDGARDGRRRVLSAARTVRAVSLWTAGELGAPFGRERVVHAAVGVGGACDRLAREVSRLETLRGGCRGGAKELQED